MHTRRRTKRLTLLHNEVPNAVRAAARPVFRGSGEVDYACPRCAATLCVGMREGALEGLVLKCGCGAFSRVGAARDRHAHRLCA